jgi:hypothetical protein
MTDPIDTGRYGVTAANDPDRVPQVTVQTNGRLTATAVLPGGGGGASNVVTGAQDNPANTSITSTLAGDGTSTATGDSAIAVGMNAAATGDRTLAVGLGAAASGAEAIAIGEDAQASNHFAIAIGNVAEASNSNAVAIGAVSSADSPESIGVGYRANAAASYAVAVGKDTDATGDGAVALGADSTGAGAQATAADQFVLGTALHHVQIPGLLNLPPETSTPTSPVNGDVWVESGGVFARVGGATVDLGGGGFAWRAVSRTSNYTAVSGDYVIVNAAAGPVTVTVPVANGTVVGVKRVDTTSNTVTVAGVSGTVNGDADGQLVHAHTSALFLGDGTNLAVVADYATGTGGSSGGGLPSRTTATATTSSLAAGATDSTTTITLAVGYRLLAVQTSRPARVRLYTTTSKRAADLSRPAGTDPTSDAGCMFEYVTPDTAVHTLSPLVDGASMESTPSTAIAMSVTNNDTATGSITVTLTWVRTE